MGILDAVSTRTLAGLRSHKTVILLWLVVFSGSLIVSSGHFHTADEVSMFVTAINIVDHGQFHTNQIGWGEWAIRPGEEQGTVTASGDVYSKKSPFMIVLMVPMVALGRLIPALGPTWAVLLLGPLLTASTAAAVYGLARALSYPSPASLLAALVYAFATIAWVFSKSVMRETVAGLALVGSLWALYAATHGLSGKQSGWRAFGADLACGAGLAVLVGANAAYLVLAPVFAVALVWARWGQIGWRRQLAHLAACGLPVGLRVAALAGSNALRFGGFLNTGYSFVPGEEGFTSPLWWGALGLILSPARGLLWYTPTSLLAIAGWRKFSRTQPVLGWTLLAVAGAHLIVFGLWWEWWGGYTWGPRFLLPLMPCLSLAALPIFEAVFAPRPLAWLSGSVVALIVLLGVAVQLGGVAIDYNTYEVELDARFPAPPGRPLLYHHDPALVYDVARSPILVHWSRLATSDLDFAWWPRRSEPKPIPDIIAAVRARQQPGDALIYLVPELLEPLVNASGLPLTYGLPVNIPASDPLAQLLFQRALRDAQREWLITWYGAGDPSDWYEAALRASWASLSDEKIDGYRLVAFARPPAQSVLQPDAYRFGAIELTAHAVARQANTLFVELHWATPTALDQDYVTFVHLLNPDGTLLLGQDRQPLGGYAPTHAWKPGQAVVDRFAFSLPPGQPSALQVEVGWYAWPSLTHLPAFDAAGQRLEGDQALLDSGP